MNKTLLLSLSLVFAGPAFADEPQFFINNISHAGSGCPAGGVAVDFDPANPESIALEFSEFSASAGPGVSPAEGRKSCQVQLELVVPAGWSFGVASANYQGWATIDPRVQGTIRSSYYFSGNRPVANLSSSFVGPLDQDVVIQDDFGPDTTVWSPCGVQRNLNINTDVRVNNLRNRQGSGELRLDKLSGIELQWRRCQ
jgi:hypothetical protein